MHERKQRPMTLKIKFKSDYNDDIEGEIKRTIYVNHPEAIALIVYAKSEYGNFMEVYQKITVNLNDTVQKDGKTVFLDTKKMDKELLKEVERFGSYTGDERKSGFMTYHAFRFFDFALKQMNEAGK